MIGREQANVSLIFNLRCSEINTHSFVVFSVIYLRYRIKACAVNNLHYLWCFTRSVNTNRGKGKEFSAFSQYCCKKKITVIETQILARFRVFKQNTPFVVLCTNVLQFRHGRLPVCFIGSRMQGTGSSLHGRQRCVRITVIETRILARFRVFLKPLVVLCTNRPSAPARAASVLFHWFPDAVNRKSSCMGGYVVFIKLSSLF